MQYNNREQLHKDLDTIIAIAEEAGQRLIITSIDTADLNLRRGKKQDPGGIDFKMGVGISQESFATQHRDTIKHLFKPGGKLDMTLFAMMAFPARTLVDFEEWKAE